MNSPTFKFDYPQFGVKGSQPGRTGVTRSPSGDTGGPRGALAILQGW